LKPLVNESAHLAAGLKILRNLEIQKIVTVVQELPAEYMDYAVFLSEAVVGIRTHDRPQHLPDGLVGPAAG
jgi:hypothetical protein